MTNKPLLGLTKIAIVFLILISVGQNCAPFDASLKDGGSSASTGLLSTVSKTLSWDPSNDDSGSIDTSVTNYKVYVGRSLGIYDNPVSVPVSVNPSISLDLEKGKTYYLAVTAVNGAGESPKATLTYVVPQ